MRQAEGSVLAGLFGLPVKSILAVGLRESVPILLSRRDVASH
jgi:hypothetical protein